MLAPGGAEASRCMRRAVMERVGDCSSSNESRAAANTCSSVISSSSSILPSSASSQSLSSSSSSSSSRKRYTAMGAGSCLELSCLGRVSGMTNCRLCRCLCG